MASLLNQLQKGVLLSSIIHPEPTTDQPSQMSSEVGTSALVDIFFRTHGLLFSIYDIQTSILNRMILPLSPAIGEMPLFISLFAVSWIAEMSLPQMALDFINAHKPKLDAALNTAAKIIVIAASFLLISTGNIPAGVMALGLTVVFFIKEKKLLNETVQKIIDCAVLPIQGLSFLFSPNPINYYRGAMTFYEAFNTFRSLPSLAHLSLDAPPPNPTLPGSNDDTALG